MSLIQFLCQNVPYKQVLLYSFVDRDMFMRFRGGGVGHRTTQTTFGVLLQDEDVGNAANDEEGIAPGDAPLAINLVDADDQDELERDSYGDEDVGEGEVDYGYQDDDDYWSEQGDEQGDNDCEDDGSGDNVHLTASQAAEGCEVDNGAEDGEDIIDDSDDDMYALL